MRRWLKVDVSEKVSDEEHQPFFPNEEGLLSLLCKNISLLVNYWEIDIYLKYCTLHTPWKLVKMWMFLRASAMKSTKFLLEWRSSLGGLCKNVLLADILESQHLFEILQTSLNVNNCKNVVKSGCFEKTFAKKSANFFRNEGGI